MRWWLVMPLLGWACAPEAPPRQACDHVWALDDGWASATATEAGFDADALCAVLDGVQTTSVNLHSVLIERHGMLVGEVYRRGADATVWSLASTEQTFGPTDRHDIRSISKSVTAMLVGIAHDQGVLDPSTPAVAVYPEFPDLQTPERRVITIDHLLTMSSGLEWNESSVPNDETVLFVAPSPSYSVLSRRVVAAPGTTFNYNGGGTAVLGDVVERQSGLPLRRFAQRHLFEPLGITDWEWMGDQWNRPMPFNGLRLRPRDLLKLGRLLLNHGQWNGQQLISASWVDALATPRLGTGVTVLSELGEFHYGRQFWTGTVSWHGRTLQWSMGLGNGGQRLYMVPELDLTIAITAGAYNSGHLGPMAHTVAQLLLDTVSAVRE